MQRSSVRARSSLRRPTPGHRRPTPALPVGREQRAKRISPIFPIGRVGEISLWGMGISSSSPLPGSIEKGESYAYSFVLSQATLVLCSLPTGRVGVGLLVLMVANNMNKTASAKIFQPERKTGFKPSKKPACFPVPSLRVCERATPNLRKSRP